MTLWFLFALMTVVAAFAVLWPLGRSARPKAGGSEATVYKDQLAEIDRDATMGLIGAPEAGAARVEIGRRLLAAADAENKPAVASNMTLRRTVAVIALAGIPLVGLAFYLPLGSPRLPDFPLADRTQTALASEPIDNLVAQVEAHLEKHPTDGRGWSVLAPVLVKVGRFDDAVRAFRNSIAYNGDSAPRRSDLGEAIAVAASGVVTAEAKAEFERAVALDAQDIKARYFLGLAAEQDGRAEEATSIWNAMLAGAPADAPWRGIVQQSLARVGSPAVPPLSESDMAVANGMNPADRSAMIHGMVDRLATRLKQDSNDVEGWLRLMRAYMVLGEVDKARGALADARQAVGDNPERLRALNEGLKKIGLDG